jgi:hypothetical protein
MGVGAVLYLTKEGQLRRLTGTIEPGEKRAQHLTALAAQEAAMIADIDVRLTRLLNLAELQMRHKWLDGARATLEASRQTLGSSAGKQLNEHARISGWVSVSELSRQARDDAGALSACDGALAAIRAIEDPARRCDYVMGVCNELQYLRGKPAAAGLLAEAGPWTKSIDDVRLRRLAVVSFASALFNLDDFARGQQMLRQEDDASWRSDTLTLLAAASMGAPAESGRVRFASSPPSQPDMQDEAAVLVTPQYGKQLNYEQVFRGQKNSQTRPD